MNDERSNKEHFVKKDESIACLYDSLFLSIINVKIQIVNNKK